MTIVRYFTFLSLFSFVVCYYLLICDLFALGRVFFKTFKSTLGLTAHRNSVLRCSGLVLRRVAMVNGNCAVVGCRNSNYRLKQWKKLDCSEHKGLCHGKCPCPRPFTLHRFPSKLLNSERRDVWIRKIRRVSAKNAAWTPGESDMVCSEHFVDGHPTVKNPDPTVTLGYTTGVKKVRRVLVRQTELSTTEPVEELNASASTDVDLAEESSCVSCVSLRAQNAALQNEIEILRAEQSKLAKKVDEVSQALLKEKSIRKPFSWKHIKSDAKMKVYTGLQTVAIFTLLFDLIKPCLPTMMYWRGKQTKSPSKCKLSLTRRQHRVTHKDQFLMVLMQIRLGILNEDLADRFCVSSGECSKMFTTWIKMLARLLGDALIVWLSRDIIQSKLPSAFEKVSPKTRCIIDCTEIFIERSKSLHVQASTWSDYKNHNTIKFLIAISPNGYVMFLSDCFGGRTSDQYICNDSGFYKPLDPGDEVMADRGFHIKEDLLCYYCSLNVPPGARVKSQMTAAECKKTKAVANLRIHVEHAINRIKEFKILKNTLPINALPLADDIIKVCAAICNIQAPLIKS